MVGAKSVVHLRADRGIRKNRRNVLEEQAKRRHRSGLRGGTKTIWKASAIKPQGRGLRGGINRDASRKKTKSG